MKILTFFLFLGLLCAQAKAYRITGNAGTANATMRLSGAATKTTASDASGAYRFTNLKNGGYTITPSRTGYTFSPVSRSVTISGSHVNGVNFAATLTPPPPPPPDTTLPSVSMTGPANSAIVSGTVMLTASASDNVGVAGVQFLVNSIPTGPEDLTAPYSASWNTTGFNNGSYNIAARARDAAGNQATSTAIQVTVDNTAPPPPSTGLVSAYGFNEGSGATVTDASGNGNTGTGSQASWVAGKYGQGLSFNGSTSFITVPDSASLDLAQGTIEAWVKRSALGTWRSVIAKGNANDNAAHNYFLEFQPDNRLMYGIGNGATSAYYQSGSTFFTDTANFHHFAMTWDGANVRLYYDGGLVQTSFQSVPAAGNAASLYIGQFGGNVDRFSGLIDEVRIYNRALSVTEIQTDMNTPIGGTPPPPPPPGGHSVRLSWNVSTSPNVAGYIIHRSSVTGGPYAKLFTTPLAATSYTDATVNSGQTYFYVATAVNASNQASAYSNQVVASIPAP